MSTYQAYDTAAKMAVEKMQDWTRLALVLKTSRWAADSVHPYDTLKCVVDDAHEGITLAPFSAETWIEIGKTVDAAVANDHAAQAAYAAYKQAEAEKSALRKKEVENLPARAKDWEYDGDKYADGGWLSD